jgi:phasin
MKGCGAGKQQRKASPQAATQDSGPSVTPSMPAMNQYPIEMFSKGAGAGLLARSRGKRLKEKPVNTTPNFEIPSAMRELAEKGINQARQAFDGFISAARQTVANTQSSAQTAETSTQDMASHSFQAAEQNVRAALDFAQKLTQAKSLQEAMQLQAEFARGQLAAVQAQATELGGIAQSAMKQGSEQAMNAAQSGADQSRMSMEEGDGIGR